MTTSNSRTVLFNKYATILNPDIGSKSSLTPHAYSSSKTRPTDILEKIIASRRGRGNYKIMVSGEKVEDGPLFSVGSPQNFQSMTSQIFFHSPTRVSTDEERKPFRTAGNLTLETTEKSNGFSSRILSDRIGTSKDNSGILQLTGSGSLPNGNKKKQYNPYFERELTIEDLYKATENVNKELQSIITQEYDEKLKGLIKNLRVNEFIETQKTRISNTISIIERRYIEKQLQESKVDQILWKIVTTEISRIRSAYEEFLFYFDETVEKISTGKEKVTNNQTDAWEAVQMIIDYSNLRRTINLTSEEFKKENRLEKLKTQIHEFKLNYKTKKNHQPKVSEMFELVESHIDHLNDLIDIEKERFEAVMKENKILLEGNKQLIKNHNEKNQELIKMTQEWKKNFHVQQKTDLPEFQKEFYDKQITSLKEELNKTNEKYKEKLRKYKALIKKNNPKEEGMLKTFQDKSSQVNFYGGVSNENRFIKLSAFISGGQINVTGGLLPQGMTLCLINLIYSDKMITDFGDDFEKRPRMTLQSYLSEWFMKRYGLYFASEMVMKDFLVSIKNGCESHERFKLFHDLLGLVNNSPNNIAKITLDEAGFIDRAKIKKCYYATAEGLKLLFKIVNYIKYDYNSHLNVFFNINTYGPYLPIIGTNLDLMSVDVAKNVMHLIMVEENFSQEDIGEAEEQFNELLSNDLYHRIMEDRPVTVNPDTQKENEGKFLRVDSFIRFIMDLVLNKEVIKLEKFYTGLKANVYTRNDGNISINEFISTVEKTIPSKSQVWRDHAFFKLMDEFSADQVPLHKLLPNMISNFINEDVAKEFYQKIRMKKDGTIVDDGSASNKTKRDGSKKSPIGQQEEGKALLQQQTPTGSGSKLLSGYKEAIHLGHPAINEAAYSVYDSLSSLGALQESYYYFARSIKEAEKNSDHLYNLHEQFLRDFDKLPAGVSKTMNNEGLSVYSQRELVDFLEHLWTKFREIITVTFRAR